MFHTNVFTKLFEKIIPYCRLLWELAVSIGLKAAPLVESIADPVPESIVLLGMPIAAVSFNSTGSFLPFPHEEILNATVHTNSNRNMFINF
jgi:hypothetical protein